LAGSLHHAASRFRPIFTLISWRAGIVQQIRAMPVRILCRDITTKSVRTGNHAATYVTYGSHSGGTKNENEEDEWRKPHFAALAPPEPAFRRGSEAQRPAGTLMKPLTVITSREPQYTERAMAYDHALGRIRQGRGLEQFVGSQFARQILHLLARGPKLLVGERQQRLYPLDVEQVEYIEADGNYVTIRVGAGEYVSRDSIKRLTAELADFGFVRIDRSTLLNIRAVQFAEPIGHGRLAFTLASGICLHSSRTYRDTIVRVLPWHHPRPGSDSEEMDCAEAVPTLRSR
jgi:hypothetical protein